jgi:hypothetical protein
MKRTQVSGSGGTDTGSGNSPDHIVTESLGYEGQSWPIEDSVAVYCPASVYFTLIGFYEGDVVTGIAICSVLPPTGSGALPTVYRAGIYSVEGSLGTKAATTAAGVAFDPSQSGLVQTANLQSPYTIPAEGAYAFALASGNSSRQVVLAGKSPEPAAYNLPGNPSPFGSVHLADLPDQLDLTQNYQGFAVWMGAI